MFRIFKDFLFFVNFKVTMLARLRSVIFNQERLKNTQLSSLTKTHVVRKGEHDGDPPELHHSRDVSAVRGRPVCNESM